MHRQIKELLVDAHGETSLVVVIFLDVRGFSSFANFAESLQSTVFLKRAYRRILDDYFPEVDFFKPTGDGLMIIRRYDEGNLQALVNDSVAKSISLVKAFPTITDDDPMVNFDVPGGLGIGIARGPSTSLVSGDKTLDYSGRPLNLASRLMDLARPAGVVFDDSLGIKLLSEELQQQFAPAPVYVKGLAEERSMTAHVLRDMVILPEYAKHPIGRHKRFTEPPERLKLPELKERGPIFLHPLTHDPTVRDSIICRVTYPVTTKGGAKSMAGYVSFVDLPATLLENDLKPHAQVDYGRMVTMLEGYGMKRTWPITVTIEYSVAPDHSTE